MDAIVTNALFDGGEKFPILFLSACEFHRQETVCHPNGTQIFHQILFVLDGKGTLHCNEKTYALKKGCAFFTAPYTPMEYRNDGGLISAFLTVCGSAADELCEAFSEGGFFFCENTDTAKYLSLIRQFIYEYLAGTDQGKLSVLAYSFYVDFLGQRQNDACDWLNEVKKYIDTHFSQRITLKDLAQRSCVSVSKLCHSFKGTYGTSVLEYVLDRRLRYARNLLFSLPDVLTKDLALMCGFSDVGYFCKTYKNKFGKTPTEDRKQGYAP